ncbi:MAG TPA: hypothetical protein V6D02_05160, partial [Candidatus Obscuribacterales bacterium]
TSRFSHPYLFTASDIHTLTQKAQFDLLEMGRYGLLPRNLWQAKLLRQEPFSVPLAAAYNRVDNALGQLLPWVCQNYFFVGRKR